MLSFFLISSEPLTTELTDSNSTEIYFTTFSTTSAPKNVTKKVTKKVQRKKPTTTRPPRWELNWWQAMGFDTESYKSTVGSVMRAPLRSFVNGLYYYMKYRN